MKVGKTLSYGNGRLDDDKALADLRFEVKYMFSSGAFIYLFIFVQWITTYVEVYVLFWHFYIFIYYFIVSRNFYGSLGFMQMMQIGDYLDVAIL